jgi:hypothetical protein
MLAEAGPWSKSQGHGYLKLSTYGLYSPQGNQGQTNVSFLSWTAAFYGEMGLGGGLQLNAFIPYNISRNTAGDAYYDIGGFADSIIGLQWTPTFLQRATGFPIAIKIDVKTPLYDFHMARQNKEVAEKGLAARFPLLGQGQLDVTGWLSIGGSIPNTPMYMYAEVGFRYRTTAYVGASAGFESFQPELQNQFTFFAQIGYKIHALRGLLIAWNNQGVVSLGDPAASPLSPTFFITGLGFFFPVVKTRGLTMALEANIDYTYIGINAGTPISATIGFSLGF